MPRTMRWLYHSTAVLVVLSVYSHRVSTLWSRILGQPSALRTCPARLILSLFRVPKSCLACCTSPSLPCQSFVLTHYSRCSRSAPNILRNTSLPWRSLVVGNHTVYSISAITVNTICRFHCRNTGYSDITLTTCDCENGFRTIIFVNSYRNRRID